jgi:3',5'-cyclic-AMP phosphodiesterase
MNNFENSEPMVFAHIGDLHITKAREQNYIDLLSISAQIEVECSKQLDFIVLPGDNADNGLPEQYRLVATALKMLSKPAHVITGDHDMEQGSLNNFYNFLATEQLPKAITVKGIKCLFLDVCGPGKGGPDFRIGASQFSWLEKELQEAQKTEIVVFVHTYPDDLRDEKEKATFKKLISENNVALVDMGHTHYNEIANDGETIFSATRSTGQIEEGPVGYSLISIDNGVVSWRFKPLQDAFPYVLITTPADYRLVRKPGQIVAGKVEIRAMVFGSLEIVRVRCKIENGNWIPMFRTRGGDMWMVNTSIPVEQPLLGLTVEATDSSGRPGQHTVMISTPLFKTDKPVKNGSDADSIGAWPENGIFDTQLGPNRNAKPSS